MAKDLRIGLVILALGLMSGCATTYRNPNLTDATAHKSQLLIDDGYCTQVAAGAAPVPPIRTYSPEQQSYTITGTGSSFNAQSGYTSSSYTGTVRPTQNFGTGFTSGFSSGASLGAAINAQNAQKKIHEGCMARLGWVSG